MDFQNKIWTVQDCAITPQSNILLILLANGVLLNLLKPSSVKNDVKIEMHANQKPK